MKKFALKIQSFIIIISQKTQETSGSDLLYIKFDILTTFFFETGEMPILTKLLNLTVCG
jgi:hypothetical protein